MCSGRVNIVGVGNMLMGDDGVGVAAVEELRRGAPEGVDLYDAGLAVSDLIGQLDPDDPLIFIDALRAGGLPGTIYKLPLADASGLLQETSLSECVSLHQISVLPALRMEAMSGRTFGDVTLFGVEPQRIEWGEGLSPAVRKSMDRLRQAVLEHANSLGGTGVPPVRGYEFGRTGVPPVRAYEFGRTGVPPVTESELTGERPVLPAGESLR